MKYKGIFLAVLLGGLTGLAGCRKDLCYDHDKHALTANVLLQPEWEKEWERDYGKGWSDNWPQEYGMEYDELRPEAATGIASFVYHQDGSRSERHHPAHGGELPMTAGEKSLLLHNDDTRTSFLTVWKIRPRRRPRPAPVPVRLTANSMRTKRRSMPPTCFTVRG